MSLLQTSRIARRFTLSTIRRPAFGARLFGAVAVLSLTVGCLSDEEKEARRAWAYDISGEYEEQRAEGVEPGSVQIDNETSKNDIVITFTRGALYEGEQQYLDLVADEATREGLLETLVLGEGESDVTEELVGGENISDNFGESSKLAVSSERFDATAKLEGATDASVHYSISAEIVNNSDELRGTLTIHYQDRRPSTEPDEEDETTLHTEDESFDIVLKRVAGPIEGDVCDDCTTGASDDEDPTVEDGTENEAESETEGDPSNDAGA